MAFLMKVIVHRSLSARARLSMGRADHGHRRDALSCAAGLGHADVIE
jgi:hypothetical protein